MVACLLAQKPSLGGIALLKHNVSGTHWLDPQQAVEGSGRQIPDLHLEKTTEQSMFVAEASKEI